MYSENSDFDFGLMIALDESYDDETNFEKFSSLQDKMLDMFLENHNINTKKLIDNVKDILNKDKDGEDESASPQNN